MERKRDDKPLISVIMPVHNGGRFIREAIESILTQTYQNFELLIANDNSSDETQRIITEHCKRFPKKIKIIHLPMTHGAYGAANQAMKIARGDFIAPMDADDVSHLRRLEKEVDYLLRHPEVILVAGQARIIDETGNVIGEKVFPTEHNEIYKKFFEVHPIVHPSCMIRRSLLPQKDRLYENKYGVNDDYYTLFTLFRHGKFANLPPYLLDYRIHLGNSSLQKIKQKFYNTVRIRLMAIKDLGYRPTIGGILKMAVQIILVTPLPESVLLTIYLYIKGIRFNNDILISLARGVHFTYFKLRSYSVGIINTVFM